MTIFVERFDILDKEKKYPNNEIVIFDKQKMTAIVSIRTNNEYKKEELLKLAQHLCTCIDDAVSTNVVDL